MKDIKHFSRRHVTSEAHISAQHAKAARVQDWVDTMEVNQEERAKRTPAQQVALLDTRLGKGKGAKKERARLALQIEAKKAKKAKKGKNK